ncbi:MAG: 2-C-methyl-D-erythritol 4-phosphate cytidylyltransferase [Magnetococcales bacterium]|nr:2-C-methyl-D-erythritol 4-phosphate cytidylyltransferase [Magnetococcales bacterium]
MSGAVNDLPCHLLLVAAGRGSRFGSVQPKQYHTVAGLPLVAHTIARCHSQPLIARIVPVVAGDGVELWYRHIEPHRWQWPKLADPVVGGAERQDSVRLGLRQLELAADDWVAIHDGVRPLLSQALLDRLLQHRHLAEALIPALPAQDTVKQSHAATQPWIATTLDRRTIWLAQTPQLFRYQLIQAAHERAHEAGFVATDDASLIEWLGQPVRLIMGERRNIKVTEPDDLLLVDLLLQQTGG